MFSSAFSQQSNETQKKVDTNMLDRWTLARQEKHIDICAMVYHNKRKDGEVKVEFFSELSEMALTKRLLRRKHLKAQIPRSA